MRGAEGMCCPSASICTGCRRGQDRACGGRIAPYCERQPQHTALFLQWHLLAIVAWGARGDGLSA